MRRELLEELDALAKIAKELALEDGDDEEGTYAAQLEAAREELRQAEDARDAAEEAEHDLERQCARERKLLGCPIGFEAMTSQERLRLACEILRSHGRAVPDGC